jgi:hypothetical protein
MRKYRGLFTTPDHLAQLYGNSQFFHRQIYSRVQKKYGVLWGGRKIPVVLDQVDANTTVRVAGARRTKTKKKICK